jgi:hypothetical protein
MLSRRGTQISQVHGIRARISSLVDVGASSPYRLPPVLAQPASQSLQYNKPGQFIPLPSIPFQEDPGWTTLSIVCRVTDPSKAVQDSSYPVQAQTLSTMQTSQSTQLQNEVLSENIETPQPEKPKWEDEQYPDIGKSTFLPEVSNYSNRHFIKPTPIHLHSAPSKIHTISQNRTPLISLVIPVHPSSAYRQIPLPYNLTCGTMGGTCFPQSQSPLLWQSEWCQRNRSRNNMPAR